MDVLNVKADTDTINVIYSTQWGAKCEKERDNTEW